MRKHNIESTRRNKLSLYFYNKNEKQHHTLLICAILDAGDPWERKAQIGDKRYKSKPKRSYKFDICSRNFLLTTFTAIWLVEKRRCLAVCSGWNMGIGSLTTAALTLGAEFDLRNVLEGKWPSSSVSIALAAILLYGSQRQHLQARKGLFRSSASARARLPVFVCGREMYAGH